MNFTRLLTQIIRLKAQFLNYAIKTIRLDNAGEFTSQTFNDYCLSTGITVEHSHRSGCHNKKGKYKFSK